MTSARAAVALRWGGGTVVAVIAVTRCVIFFAGRLYFDVDPLVDPSPLGGLGPAGSLWLDCLLLLACGAALCGETLSGRGLMWPLLVAAAIPIPVAVWHGTGDTGDLWRGATWVSAALAAVTVTHLARERALRAVMVGIMLSVLGPLFARGLANVTYEYDGNIAAFEAHRAAILADKGWAPGSSQARIFERRLRHRQPAGWFVTPNIYASIMAFGCVACVGLALASARARLASGWTGLMMLIVAGALLAVWATGSKGAMLTTAAGLVLVVLPFLHPRLARVFRRYGPAIAVLCVFGALLGVFVRGALLPESFAGDRSLLFRWHYTVSSAGIVESNAMVGVGPAGYQAAYVAHRLPRNPEEVASAHSVFWDWLAALGLGGAAWIALVVVLLWRAGRALGSADVETLETDTNPEDAPLFTLRTGALVTLAALVGLCFALRVEAADPRVVPFRIVGIGLAVFFGLAVARIVARGDRGAIGWALAAAAVVLAVHGQIEMTFTQPGACVWCMCALGLAGARTAPAPPESASAVGSASAMALAFAIGAGGLAIRGAIPAMRAERLIAEAAETIGVLGRQPAAPSAAAEVAARRKAAALLAEAFDIDPGDVELRLDAAEELRRAAMRAAPAEQVTLLREALDHVVDVMDRGDHGRASALAVATHRRLAELTGDPSHRDMAVDIARSMVRMDPNGLSARLRYADVLWEADRRDEARAEYRRALEIDEAFGLDPLKQLPETQRALVVERAGA